jgi:hypothetical protein
MDSCSSPLLIFGLNKIRLPAFFNTGCGLPHFNIVRRTTKFNVGED